MTAESALCSRSAHDETVLARRPQLGEHRQPSPEVGGKTLVVFLADVRNQFL
jgi:hypothetical protein